MMTEEMMKRMPNMMNNASHAMSTPLAKGAMMAASGFAAGRSLLGFSLLRNPLTLLAVGLYGEELLPQNGAPIRLVVPWKYGFKSIKSIVRIRFSETLSKTAWMKAAPREYGFYANVNPAVDHPRWSQASERRIGEFLRRKTLPFNGYADQVASLYSGMDLAVNY